MPLDDLAHELIDAILFSVDSPRDLLHFALASKWLSNIIIPAHLSSRVVEFRPSATPVGFWFSLIAMPAQAQRIRYFRRSTNVKVRRCPPILLSASVPSQYDLYEVIMQGFSKMTSVLCFEEHSTDVPLSHLIPHLAAVCPRLTTIKISKEWWEPEDIGACGYSLVGNWPGTPV